MYTTFLVSCRRFYNVLLATIIEPRGNIFERSGESYIRSRCFLTMFLTFGPHGLYSDENTVICELDFVLVVFVRASDLVLIFIVLCKVSLNEREISKDFFATQKNLLKFFTSVGRAVTK